MEENQNPLGEERESSDPFWVVLDLSAAILSPGCHAPHTRDASKRNKSKLSQDTSQTDGQLIFSVCFCSPCFGWDWSSLHALLCGVETRTLSFCQQITRTTFVDTRRVKEISICTICPRSLCCGSHSHSTLKTLIVLSLLMRSTWASVWNPVQRSTSATISHPYSATFQFTGQRSLREWLFALTTRQTIPLSRNWMLLKTVPVVL
mmetsp:Transcript_4652/g.17520  ORF Transcript_4652/g.17520 Transcript_4652/m.17520 type:complete len:205 (+) Transcript_4652:355-969(+)